MGTRANFRVITDDFNLLFYTGGDGYPDCLGEELVGFLDEIKGCSKSDVIAFFEDYCYEYCDWDTVAGDIEYYYEVFPEKGTVSAYQVDWRTGTQTELTQDLAEWLEERGKE